VSTVVTGRDGVRRVQVVDLATALDVPTEEAVELLWLRSAGRPWRPRVDTEGHLLVEREQVQGLLLPAFGDAAGALALLVEELGDR